MSPLGARVVVVAVVAGGPGCGRIGFAAHDDAATIDAPVAALIDAPAAAASDCWAAWRQPTPALDPIVKLAALDTDAMDERDPSLGDDGLTLYYDVGVAGASYATHAYAATRPDRDSPFAAPTDLVQLDSADVSKLAVGGSDLEMVISAEYDGGVNDEDLWTGARGSATTPWPMPVATSTGNVNNANHQLDPQLSADALTLYYSELTPDLTSQRIMRTTRPSLHSPFAAPAVVDTGSTDSVGDPAVSPDETLLLYTERSSIAIAVSLRASTSAPWLRQGPLAAIDTPDAHDAAFTRDGCELLFSSTRDGTYDLFEVRVTGATP